MRNVRYLFLVLLVSLAAGCASTASSPSAGPGRSPSTAADPPPTPASPQSPLVGAYYSDWFPSNSIQGTLRQHLVPAQGTDPTQVNSADPSTAEAAIAQASRSGVSFFALDWWPSRAAQNQNVDAFLRAKNLGDIKFCMFYETWDLGFDPRLESTQVNPQMEATFDANLLQFARRYFSNPSYLRVAGRPVVVLYLTRTLTGDVGGMISGARRVLASHGYDPYLIGDEVYWRTTAETPFFGPNWLTQTPQVSRITLFDAITGYSLYVGDANDLLAPSDDFVGAYPGQTHIVQDETGLYRRYSAATLGSVPVIPDVTPGENTRGVRLSVDEPAEPRRWLPGQPAGSTLQNFLWQIAKPVLDPRAPIVFTTTWNEWNEDTAIQPVGGTPTAKDNSPTGSAYTQGFTYGGEGSSDLGAIRDFVAVAWGQVCDSSGRPLVGADVAAVRNGIDVSTARTDSRGWYLLRRTSATAGLLVITGSGAGRPVITSASTAIRVDFGH